MQVANRYILVADDDAEDRQALIDEITHQNPALTVKEVDGGPALLEFLRDCPSQHLPVVIVLDYQMPGLTGPEILQLLSRDARFSQITIVMWSTSIRTKDMEECRQLGAIDYLIKPDSIGELKSSINKLMTYFQMAVRFTM